MAQVALLTEKTMSLEYVIAKTIPAILRIHHLNRDVIIGFIGERGGGKSLSAATVAALDYGVEGDVLRSNMQIAFDIGVSQELAEKYGVSPGTVHYESQELNKTRFLNYHPSYFRSVYVIDEINLWIADARRAMANQNLMADDVAQQLRKGQSPLFYTCIHEMFVDSRIRDMTDLFIRTEDTALTEAGLRNHQRQGLTFQWKIYPMTKKFTGHTYRENHTPIGPIDFNGRLFWGIIDTLKRQKRKKYVPGEEDNQPLVIRGNVKEDRNIISEREKWGWLYEKLLALHENGIKEIEDDSLWEYLELDIRGIAASSVGTQLRKMGVENKPGRHKHFFYIIDNFDLSAMKKDTGSNGVATDAAGL